MEPLHADELCSDVGTLKIFSNPVLSFILKLGSIVFDATISNELA